MLNPEKQSAPQAKGMLSLGDRRRARIIYEKLYPIWDVETLVGEDVAFICDILKAIADEKL